MDQELLTVPEHLSSPSVFSEGSCYSIFSFMCMFCRSLFVLLLLAIVLSVLRFTDSDYPFSIFKLFLDLCQEALVLFYQKKAWSDRSTVNFATSCVYSFGCHNYTYRKYTSSYNNIINVDKQNCRNFIMTSAIVLILQYFWSSMKWFKVDNLIRVFLKNYTVKCKYLFWFKKIILIKIVVFVYLCSTVSVYCLFHVFGQ